VKQAMKYEPVMVMALVGAVLGVLVAFNVPITPDQHDAIMKLVNALLPFLPGIIAALVARSFAYAPATVERIEAQKDAEILALKGE